MAMQNTDDFIDAQFETIAATGSRKSSQSFSIAATAATQNDAADVQLGVFGKKPNSVKSRPMSLPMFSFVASLCAVGAFYFAGGHVLFAPPTPKSIEAKITVAEAAPTQIQMLRFENIFHTISQRGSDKIISVKATIFNTDIVARIIPPVIVQIGENSATARKFLINRGETLKPGERMVFTNTLNAGEGEFVKPILSFSE
ncbi:MAG: hypothetical protein U5K75_01370 [Ahrensia sp.]|nr:hypothetical protein [Ahrensia sp.]